MVPDRGATRFSGWFSGSADGALTPELDALRQAFTERGFEVEELQAIIDGLVERVRSAIEEGTG